MPDGHPYPRFECYCEVVFRWYVCRGVSAKAAVRAVCDACLAYQGISPSPARTRREFGNAMRTVIFVMLGVGCISRFCSVGRTSGPRHATGGPFVLYLNKGAHGPRAVPCVCKVWDLEMLRQAMHPALGVQLTNGFHRKIGGGRLLRGSSSDCAQGPL